MIILLRMKLFLKNSPTVFFKPLKMKLLSHKNFKIPSRDSKVETLQLYWMWEEFCQSGNFELMLGISKFLCINNFFLCPVKMSLYNFKKNVSFSIKSSFYSSPDSKSNFSGKATGQFLFFCVFYVLLSQ